MPTLTGLVPCTPVISIVTYLTPSGKYDRHLKQCLSLFPVSHMAISLLLCSNCDESSEGAWANICVDAIDMCVANAVSMFCTVV